MPGGTRSFEMARRFVKWGHEVHMITSERAGKQTEKWRRTEEAGIHVHWTPVPYSNVLTYGERVKAFFSYAYRAGRKAVEIGGDIVFATSTPLTISLPAVYAKKKLNVPMVFEVRDLWPELPIAVGALKNPLIKSAARRLEKFAYHHSDHIVALSPGMKEGVIAAGYPEEKISVIPNSSDIELFDVPETEGQRIRKEYSWLGDRPLVSYIGTLGRINGVGYLARLAAAIQELDPEVRFVVIGSGFEEEAIKKEARELGIYEKNFFMLGRMPKKVLPAWFSASTVTCSLVVNLKEIWNNSANKFFDSLAAGRPIAINYEGWQAELLRSSGAGLVLDPVDIDKAAAVLKEKIDDETWLRESRRVARLLAEEQFDREKLARKMCDVLERTNQKENQH